MKLIENQEVRYYHDDEWYERGEITTVTPNYVTVDFADYTMRFRPTDFRPQFADYLDWSSMEFNEIAVATRLGIRIEDYGQSEAR